MVCRYALSVAARRNTSVQPAREADQLTVMIKPGNCAAHATAPAKPKSAGNAGEADIYTGISV
jgi:hypothetical protein